MSDNESEKSNVSDNESDNEGNGISSEENESEKAELERLSNNLFRGVKKNKKFKPKQKDNGKTVYKLLKNDIF